MLSTTKSIVLVALLSSTLCSFIAVVNALNVKVPSTVCAGFPFEIEYTVEARDGVDEIVMFENKAAKIAAPVATATVDLIPGDVLRDKNIQLEFIGESTITQTALVETFGMKEKTQYVLTLCNGNSCKGQFPVQLEDDAAKCYRLHPYVLDNIPLSLPIDVKLVHFVEIVHLIVDSLSIDKAAIRLNIVAQINPDTGRSFYKLDLIAKETFNLLANLKNPYSKRTPEERKLCPVPVQVKAGTVIGTLLFDQSTVTLIDVKAEFYKQSADPNDCTGIKIILDPQARGCENIGVLYGVGKVPVQSVIDNVSNLILGIVKDILTQFLRSMAGAMANDACFQSNLFLKPIENDVEVNVIVHLEENQATVALQTPEISMLLGDSNHKYVGARLVSENSATKTSLEAVVARDKILTLIKQLSNEAVKGSLGNVLSIVTGVVKGFGAAFSNPKFIQASMWTDKDKNPFWEFEKIERSVVSKVLDKAKAFLISGEVAIWNAKSHIQVTIKDDVMDKCKLDQNLQVFRGILATDPARTELAKDATAQAKKILKTVLVETDSKVALPPNSFVELGSHLQLRTVIPTDAATQSFVLPFLEGTAIVPDKLFIRLTSIDALDVQISVADSPATGGTVTSTLLIKTGPRGFQLSTFISKEKPPAPMATYMGAKLSIPERTDLIIGTLKRTGNQYVWDLKATDAFVDGIKADASWRLISTGSDPLDVVVKTVTAGLSLTAETLKTAILKIVRPQLPSYLASFLKDRATYVLQHPCFMKVLNDPNSAELPAPSALTVGAELNDDAFVTKIDFGSTLQKVFQDNTPLPLQEGGVSIEFSHSAANELKLEIRTNEADSEADPAYFRSFLDRIGNLLSDLLGSGPIKSVMGISKAAQDSFGGYSSLSKELTAIAAKTTFQITDRNEISTRKCLINGLEAELAVAKQTLEKTTEEEERTRLQVIVDLTQTTLDNEQKLVKLYEDVNKFKNIQKIRDTIDKLIESVYEKDDKTLEMNVHEKKILSKLNRVAKMQLQTVQLEDKISRMLWPVALVVRGQKQIVHTKQQTEFNKLVTHIQAIAGIELSKDEIEAYLNEILTAEASTLKRQKSTLARSLQDFIRADDELQSHHEAFELQVSDD